MFEVYIGLIL